MRQTLLTLFCFLSTLLLSQDCRPTIYNFPLSNGIANYKMKVTLEPDKKLAQGSSKVTWINSSSDTVDYLRFYMYLNAFSHEETSYLRDPNGRFGNELSGREEIEWGYVKMISPKQEGVEKELSTRFVQPNDGNQKDSSVLELQLIEPVLPGDSVFIEFDFISKLPRTIARSGWGENEFFHFVHWYPKLGVFELDDTGIWDWNCHQFLPRMEFYGDFGDYDVTIHAPHRFVIGASGCPSEDVELGGVKTIRYIAEDVIDFAWCASPHLEVVEDTWKHVEIKMLSARAHEGLRDRLMGAAKNGLTYLEEHIGEYPYSTLTILDPPMHGLRSGFMEYPTYITGGAFHNWPKGIKTIESLIIHELVHQYFMQMLATNEKEEPWLDEGFTTFYEDMIMEEYYDADASLIDLYGYRISNSEFTREEYRRSTERPSSPIATNSWEVQGGYKDIIYAKTATVLQTIRRTLGDVVFDNMIRSYFEKHKFTHPDRKAVTDIIISTYQDHDNILSPYIDQFLSYALDSSNYVDFAIGEVSEVENSSSWEYNIELKNIGGFIIPLELEFTWSDGVVTQDIIYGDFDTTTYSASHKSRLVSVVIDPDDRFPLDINRLNNGFYNSPSEKGKTKYLARVLYWAQQIFQTSSFGL